MAENERLGKQPDLGQAASLSADEEFLRVDQAFRLDAWKDQDSTLRVVWQIADGYYLYKHRLGFTRSPNPENVTAHIPAGKSKTDEYFGDVEVYYHQLEVALPNIDSLPADANGNINLRLSYQGCADAGLCYPPQNRYLTLSGDNLISFSNSAPGAVSMGQGQVNPTSGIADFSPEQNFTQLLASAKLVSIIGLFFLAGLALTFTPCVLPMVPIISGIVVGQQHGRARAFSLSLTYVLAMALTYALAGTLTGYFGAGLNLQMHLQSPWILTTIGLLFVLLALSMFGLYELRLPGFIQNRLYQLSSEQSGGNYAGVATMGVLSSLIVSPCVSAPLAGALVYIGSTSDPVLGGLALLALGMGMGTPLLIIGTFGAKLLPKSGQWMDQVKTFFGVVMLGMALWMVDRIIPAPLTLALAALLLLGYGIFLFAPRGKGTEPLTSKGRMPATACGGVLALYGLVLLAGAINGGANLLNPVANFSSEAGKQQSILKQFQAVSDLDSLKVALKKAEQEQKPVLLDVYADWCISCRVIEHEVFTESRVAETMQDFTLLRVDITDNLQQHQALLDYYGLFGPPALLFFSPAELNQFRVQGEVSAKDFKKRLDAVIQATSPAT